MELSLAHASMKRVGLNIGCSTAVQAEAIIIQHTRNGINGAFRPANSTGEANYSYFIEGTKMFFPREN